MSLQDVPVGRDVPNDVNVIIEIPMNSPAIKYEVDKASGAVFVDRMLKTAMHYPCNYGYIPHTLCGDGDPVDVLVVMPFQLVPGVVVRCRPVGLLRMEDESGDDAKIIAVPVTDITGLYRDVEELEDIDELLRMQIAHFFAHYKDLERGKWVKVSGWEGIDSGFCGSAMCSGSSGCGSDSQEYRGAHAGGSCGCAGGSNRQA
jgi:inorganic pyrophosphatase